MVESSVGSGGRVIIAVVATASCAGAARETVRSVHSVMPGVRCEVLDVDGVYLPCGTEKVRTASEADLLIDEIRLTHDDSTMLTALTALWGAHLLDHGEPVLALVAGIALHTPLQPVEDPRTTVAVVRAAAPVRPLDPDTSVLATELYLLGTDVTAHRRSLHELVTDWRTAGRWLDLFIARVPHRIIVDDAALVSRANAGPDTLIPIEDGHFAVDGKPVVAFDLVGLDPDAPWLFDARKGPSSGPLLSRNRALAQYVRDVAERERAIVAPAFVVRADAGLVREIARFASERGDSLEAAVADLDDWLVELLPSGARTPVARYLAGIHRSRTDLAHVFPQVPGRDSDALAHWALEYGVNDARYDCELVRRAAAVTIAAQPPSPQRAGRRPRGVNLVGYLSGALGIGTSARLMDAALVAARIPTSTFAASVDLQSRATASFRRSTATRYDTSVIAVNADQAKAVTESMADVVARSYRIGMWYWEVESFPASSDGAYAVVDEVWVATDFIRDAVAQRAPVPVRTVMPPLPQRSAGEAADVPARVGIPAGRPWFFFAFDYLSTMERKNPLGLIEAFARAFPANHDDGPILVIKTLNADLRVADAERLRIVASARTDVLIIDDYLESDELTALMARCTAYVSLHRAEGLGLTIAEAMAWGRPVVVSAYSGSMQFTNERNAFLVPCAKIPIPVGADPYPAGTPWADPDLDEAASALRRILADPDTARAVGQRAAEDIRVLHSPAASGERVREALEDAWRRQSALRVHTALSRVRSLPRRAWSRLHR